MHKCYQCAYHGTIPGDRHILCRFDWKKSALPPPKADEHGVNKGWYMFPINFDPVWQIGECQSFATKIDPDYYVNAFDSISLLFSILK